jgi:hypothetical protein
VYLRLGIAPPRFSGDIVSNTTVVTDFPETFAKVDGCVTMPPELPRALLGKPPPDTLEKVDPKTGMKTKIPNPQRIPWLQAGCEYIKREVIVDPKTGEEKVKRTVVRDAKGEIVRRPEGDRKVAPVNPDQNFHNRLTEVKKINFSLPPMGGENRWKGVKILIEWSDIYQAQKTGKPQFYETAIHEVGNIPMEHVKHFGDNLMVVSDTNFQKVRKMHRAKGTPDQVREHVVYVKVDYADRNNKQVWVALGANGLKWMLAELSHKVTAKLAHIKAIPPAVSLTVAPFNRTWQHAVKYGKYVTVYGEPDGAIPPSKAQYNGKPYQPDYFEWTRAGMPRTLTCQSSTMVYKLPAEKYVDSVSMLKAVDPGILNSLAALVTKQLTPFEQKLQSFVIKRPALRRNKVEFRRSFRLQEFYSMKTLEQMEDPELAFATKKRLYKRFVNTLMSWCRRWGRTQFRRSINIVAMGRKLLKSHAESKKELQKRMAEVPAVEETPSPQPTDPPAARNKRKSTTPVKNAAKKPRTEPLKPAEIRNKKKELRARYKKAIRLIRRGRCMREEWYRRFGYTHTGMDIIKELYDEISDRYDNSMTPADRLADLDAVSSDESAEEEEIPAEPQHEEVLEDEYIENEHRENEL